ncbi:MAG: DNA polymerase III subunit delta [Clostridia bacterium]|nr:DNA polymerase III subunit delta [Clostridia bacterium]MBR5991884.1 DNA polymerase III subunit delta [Clostridia bacterium]
MLYDVKEIRQDIKTGDFKRVYLIKGEESYLKQKYANLLADSVVPAGLEAFNVHKLDGEKTNADEISVSVEALPVMCDRSCVLVHDFDFDGSNETERNKLIELFSNLPDTCVLVFWQDTVGFSTKTKHAKEILALIEKNGAVCDIGKRDQGDLIRFVTAECTRRERNISFDAANYLVNCVGDDVANLLNEVEKVCAFTDGEITMTAIDEVCIKSVEATAFQMIDALLINNFDKALTDIKILFEQKTEPTMIMGALVSTFVDMYRVKLAQETGHKPSDLKAVFPVAYKSDFKLRNAAKRAERYTLKSLELSLEILSRADFKLKSSFDDNRIVFEKLLIELAKARKAK